MSTAEIKSKRDYYGPRTTLFKLTSDYETYLRLIVSAMNRRRDLMDLKIDYANDCMLVSHAWKFIFGSYILMKAKFCKTSTVIEFDDDQVIKSWSN